MVEPDTSPLAARLPLNPPVSPEPELVDIAENQVGTGPFAQPPRVTRPAPRHEPAPTDAVTAPAHLLPAAPMAIPASLPQQSSPDHPPRDVEAPAPWGVVRRTETATVLLPQAVPAQRTYPPPPPPARVRRRRPPGRPSVSLPILVVLALASAFFAWISAEPFWLAVGHGHNGTATVFSAPNGCRAGFVADDGSFTVTTVPVAGLRSCPDGATAPARMVSERSDRVYITDVAGLHARWSIGFGLIILCGLAIAAATGGGRLPGWRGTVAVALSLLAPALVTATMLALSY